MQTRIYPLTMIDLIDLLISGREKLAVELVTEFRTHEKVKSIKVNY